MPRLEPPTPICDDAEFWNAGLERLWLTRRVADAGPVGLVLGLNPSRADAVEDDHTIKKMRVFAERWGWSGFIMANLFTCVETYSAKLKNLAYHTAVGEYGSRVLERLVYQVPHIVCCWGAAVPKQKRHRVSAVQAYLRVLARPDAKLWCFGLAKDGSPVHPLMLGYDTPLVPYVLPEQPRVVSRRGGDE